VPILEYETAVNDSEGRVLYQPLNSEYYDSFSYVLKDSKGHISNEGEITISVYHYINPDYFPTRRVNVMTPSGEVLVVMFIALLFAVGLAIFFSVFLYRRKKAREEFIGFLSFSQQDDGEGGTTFYRDDDSSADVLGSDSENNNSAVPLENKS